MGASKVTRKQSTPRAKAKAFDSLIGKNLHKFRVKKGLTQKQLGDLLGLTFQQIQKYENATNRVSAARLFMLSSILEVPLISFYEEKEPTGTSKEAIARLSPEGAEVGLKYDRLGRNDVKQAISVLLEDLKP